jgi:hypothetical protein
MNVESVLDLTDLLLIQLATLQKVGIPFQSNDLNVRKLLTPLFKPCISMSIFRCDLPFTAIWRMAICGRSFSFRIG